MTRPPEQIAVELAEAAAKLSEWLATHTYCVYCSQHKPTHRKWCAIAALDVALRAATEAGSK